MKTKIPTRLINPQVLLWAMLRAEITPQELMRKTRIKNFSSLLQGNGYITRRQLMKLAQALHIPYAYLFLSQVPVEMDMVDSSTHVCRIDFDEDFEFEE